MITTADNSLVAAFPFEGCTACLKDNILEDDTGCTDRTRLLTYRVPTTKLESAVSNLPDIYINAQTKWIAGHVLNSSASGNDPEENHFLFGTYSGFHQQYILGIFVGKGEFNNGKFIAKPYLAEYAADVKMPDGSNATIVSTDKSLIFLLRFTAASDPKPEKQFVVNDPSNY